MVKNIKVIEGKVESDRYGSWSDCSPGLYIDTDKIESLFADYFGKTIKITIEEINENG